MVMAEERVLDRGVTPESTDGRSLDQRSVGRRRPLPGTRAVVGALLVALAALGTFMAYTDATAPPSVGYVVAGVDLAPGHVLSASDLTTAPMDLAPGVASRSFTRPDSLVGATVLAPLAAGELVQASHLVRLGDEATGARSMSFPVEADLALAGALRQGERIDVVATFGSGQEAYTTVVVRHVAVTGITDAGAAMGGRFTVVTVALETNDDVLALAHAVRAGKVTVVRSTGADQSEVPVGVGDADHTYRPPSPRGEAAGGE